MKKQNNRKLYFPMLGKFWCDMDASDRIELILMYLTLLVGSVAMSIFLIWGIKTML